MRSSLVRLLLISGLLTVTACTGPRSPDGGGRYIGREALLDAEHPRLVLTPEVQERLRGQVDGSHEWLWSRLERDLPSRQNRVSSRIEEELNRGHADLAPELAFAWIISGRRDHFESAREHLLTLAHSSPWPPENDLVHGHLLQGMALAYDWLYPRLSGEDRAVISERLKLEAANEYQRMTTGRVWYRNQYFQNHGISNFCGLAFAACALWGEDERAEDWLAAGEEFMDIVLEVLPADGTSLEGISYGAYDYEFIVRYVELARTMLARDYTDTPGLKNFPRWVLHSMLPERVPAEWAMTFGDAPRHVNWHGPEAQLFFAASAYGDRVAQWAGRHLIELEPEGLGSATWWSLLFYDDSVPAADPEDFPLYRRFTENDQVMARSAWGDPRATLLGLKAGPFMGRTHSRTAGWDWGTNHQEPDAGSFQFFSRGAQLAIDPGYTIFKRTANHNAMLFKGQGQLGEDVPWMGVAECLHYRHYPHVVHSEDAGEYVYTVADLERAYHPALNLDRYQRHYLYIRPDILLVADEFGLGEDGALFSYPARDMQVSGNLEHGWGGYVVGAAGEAWVEFDGPAGEYRIAVNYLDNFPGEGRFGLRVDGETVHEWQTTDRHSDNHYIVSPPVKLRPGSRVSWVGENMPHNCRLMRLAISGRSAPSERSAAWLLHVSADADVETDSLRVSAAGGGAALDVYVHQPGGEPALTVEDWEVLEPDAEVEATKRIVVRPSFDGDRAALINVLHARAVDGDRLDGLRCNVESAPDRLRAMLNWQLDGKSWSLDWDLRGRQVLLTVN